MQRVTRRSALWQADLDAGVCPAPEECVEALRVREHVPLVLEHREHGLTPVRLEFESTLRQDVEWQFGGIGWPPDLRPGVLVTVVWQAARDEIVVRTAPLDEPMRVDGVDYFHEYDPRVVTREFDAGGSNRAKVLHAVRKAGRIFEDGSAVLPEPELAGHCGLGRGARGAFLLRNAVDQLIREGYLTRVDGSVDSAGYPSYPAVDGQKPAEMLFYAPLVEPAPYPGEEDDDEDGPDGADRREHWVHGFVRRLPPGAQPSERQVSLHERAIETEEVTEGPLAPGYTFVRKHHRHG
ncbi:hypothetical protein Asp14428_68090 [Actinoplanes sp. NBRC 14428]|uniref:Uncharacterized protein n=1 Tax=Pseudosporangium ferrugineum TaxID=439699 RepID=A0A2T0RQ96_9ACTN|nr:hypothetical protein [Pseudosporangium ferrugineum]PRY23348.1 hypothetical protein CLV70_11575 [Pseudosporangium ferrugineum]BCJ55334.1 hypothetical protein Asp14428_68090 [Actinoplanes sp. NBRC 14428]